MNFRFWKIRLEASKEFVSIYDEVGSRHPGKDHKPGVHGIKDDVDDESPLSSDAWEE